MFLHDLLDQRVGLEVNTRRGFIDKHNFPGVEKRACNVDELLLSRTQIISTLSHSSLESLLLLKLLPYPTKFESLDNLLVSMELGGVNVFFDGACE